MSEHPPVTETSTLTYCANHPQVETSLRCNRCEKPICTRCAVLTPTGYRCKECVRGQQKTFETAQWFDYPLAFTLAAVISGIGSYIIPQLGFFTIFLSPVAGVIIAEVARYVVRRRRSKRLFQLTAAAAALGSLPMLLFFGLSALMLTLNGAPGGLLNLIWQAVYTFTVTSTVYYRLSGIRMNV
jgi:hypothetical protein